MHTPWPRPSSWVSRKNWTVFPTGPSGLWLTCLLAGGRGTGCLDRVFAAPESPWLSQAPQTRHKRKWAQQKEEGAYCLAVLAGDLLGEIGYLSLMGLMMLRTFIKVGDDPDILPT